MATHCATPQLLTYDYSPVMHQQQGMLQASSRHPIQGAAHVTMTAAVVSGSLPAYCYTHRVFKPSPCYEALIA